MKTRRSGEWLEVIVPEKWDGMTVDRIIRKEYHVPRKLVHRFRSMREVVLNNEQSVHWKATRVKTGDLLKIRLFKPQAMMVSPTEMDIDVVFEDDHLLVVNKPSGIYTHPNTSQETDTLVNGVAAYFKKENIHATPKYVHRLDRNTSGAILFAKHDLAIAMLGRELQQRKIKRTYIAWAQGKISIDKGKICEPIGKDPEHTVRRCVSESGQFAETHYEVLFYDEEKRATLIKLQLETGRTHQIRVHMSFVGHPLLGDEMYGGKAELDFQQALHAARLTFIHPFTEKKVSCLALPDVHSTLFTEAHVKLLES